MKRQLVYKDANRIWWKVILTETDDFVLDREADGTHTGDRHKVWHYDIYNDLTKDKPVYSGIFTGQYDCVPMVECILNALMNDFTNVLMGMNRYTDMWKEYVPPTTEGSTTTPSA